MGNVATQGLIIMTGTIKEAVPRVPKSVLNTRFDDSDDEDNGTGGADGAGGGARGSESHIPPAFLDAGTGSEPEPRELDQIQSISPLPPDTPPDTPPDIELVKRRGRPPGPSNRGPRNFPAPALVTYSSGDKRENCQPGAFIKYWQRLYADPEFRERLLVYVYRNWPVTDRERTKHPITGKPIKNKAIEGPMAQCPDKLDDIYHWYGSGDYKIYLADGAFKPSKQIAKCYIEGVRDFDDFPPVIDIEDLVLEDPKNRSYIEWRKRKGLIVPGQESESELKQREEAMAAETTVTQLVQSNEKLLDRVITMADRDRDRDRDRAGADNTPPNTPIQEYSAQVMQEASQAAINLVSKSAAQAIDTISTHNNQQQDPIAGVGRVIELVRQLTPPPVSGGGESSLLVQALQVQNERLMARLEKMDADRIERLEAELQRRMEGDKSLVKSETARPKTLTDQLAELTAFKRTMSELMDDDKPNRKGGGGTGDDEPAAKQEWWEKLLPMAIPLGMYALSVVSNVMHNQAVVAAKSGNPEAPPPPPPVDPSTIPPEARAMMKAAQAQSQPQPPQAPGAPGGQQQDMNININPIMALVRMIERPLIQHINRGDTGHQFAGWFIEGQGMDVYGQVKAFGKDQLVQALSTYSPGVIQALLAMGQTECDRFLDQFMAGPEDPEDKEEGE